MSNDKMPSRPQRPVIGGINWGDMEDVRQFAHKADAHIDYLESRIKAAQGESKRIEDEAVECLALTMTWIKGHEDRNFYPRATMYRAEQALEAWKKNRYSPPSPHEAPVEPAVSASERKGE